MPKPRPTVASSKVRRFVMERDKMVCQLCGRTCRTHADIFGPGASRRCALPGEDPLAEAGVLLLVPRAEGGTLDVGNLVTACKRCSSSKQGRSMSRWEAAMLHRYDWEETRL